VDDARQRSNAVVRVVLICNILSSVVCLLARVVLSDVVGQPAILKFVLSFLSDAHPTVISASILALGELMLHAARTNDADTVITIAKTLAPFIMSDVAQIRQDTATRFQLLGEASLESSVLVYEHIVPHLLSRSVDSNGPVRSSIVGAMHALFQFHVDFEKAEKLLGAYHAKASKKDAGAATALLIFVKKSVAKATITQVQDELWQSKQGESLADGSASSTAAAEEDDEE
jgi:hypothetical protein